MTKRLIIYKDEGDKATNTGMWFVYDCNGKPDNDAGPFKTKKEAQEYKHKEELAEKINANAYKPFKYTYPHA